MEVAFRKKVSWKMESLCCHLDLNIATRIIGCFGVILSVVMVNILIKDTMADDYQISRKMAHALGLDWQHFHSAANATEHADPEGKLLSSMIMTYAVVYLFTNSMLILATILNKTWCTIPWLVVELFGWLSKIVALCYHLGYDENNQSILFIVGSSLYVVIIFWLMLVVIAMVVSWSARKSVELIDEGPVFNLQRTNRITFGFNDDDTFNSLDTIVAQSPKPYQPTTYTEI